MVAFSTLATCYVNWPVTNWWTQRASQRYPRPSVDGEFKPVAAAMDRKIAAVSP